MVDNIKPEYDSVANETYGQGENPMNFMPQGNLTHVAGNASFAAALGLNVVETAVTQTGPRNDPGFHA